MPQAQLQVPVAVASPSGQTAQGLRSAPRLPSPVQAVSQLPHSRLPVSPLGPPTLLLRAPRLAPYHPGVLRRSQASVALKPASNLAGLRWRLPKQLLLNPRQQPEPPLGASLQAPRPAHQAFCSAPPHPQQDNPLQRWASPHSSLPLGVLLLASVQMWPLQDLQARPACLREIPRADLDFPGQLPLGVSQWVRHPRLLLGLSQHSPLARLRQPQAQLPSPISASAMA